MNKRYYCFPDIHGCSSALNKALDYVYRSNPEGGKIIFLGDYIDRGPDSIGVLKTVMNPPKGWDFVCLLGNHEEMYLDTYHQRTHFYDHEAAKNIAGFGSYENVSYDQIWEYTNPTIIEWMDNLKPFHIEGQNVFAHAFYDDTLSPENQNKHNCIWTRMSDFESFQNTKQDLYLTHGHTPRKHGPIKAPNRVNLDAGAVFYGNYVIGEYCTDIAGPVQFHEFKFDNFP
jgi:serine/threonine protein phosphatase 1